MSKEIKDVDEFGEMVKRQPPPKKRVKKGAKDKDDTKDEIRVVEEEQIDEAEEPVTEEKDPEPPKKKGKKTSSKKEKASEIENVEKEKEVTTEGREENPTGKVKATPNKKQAKKATPAKYGKKTTEEKELSDEPASEEGTDEDNDGNTVVKKKKSKKATPAKNGKKTTDEKELSDEPASEEGTDEDNDGNTVVKKKKSKGKKMDHPKTVDMIIEAINFLNDSHGSSVKAIKTYILENYKVREDLIKHMMKNAFTVALKRNILARPKGQIENQRLIQHTLLGSYIMNTANNEEEDDKKATPRARPASLRQFKATSNGKANAGKKKKRKKRTCH